MASTALVWLRRDLRTHDHPALSLATREHEHVVPVFVLDPAILRGRFPSPARAAFLHGCLRELDATLRGLGAGLVIREGRPWEELPRLALQAGADTTSRHMRASVTSACVRPSPASAPRSSSARATSPPM
jgi:deoxyribodipyrimidine photo-lyase